MSSTVANDQHLQRRGNVWWFIRRVPKSLKHLYPDSDRIQKSLETTDIHVARARRDLLVAEMSKQTLSDLSGERALFRRYMEELKAIKDKAEKDYDRLLSSMSHEERMQEEEFPHNAPVWDRVLSPDEVGKEQDKAYVDAFRTVTAGKESHPDYAITLLEALEEYVTHRKGDLSKGALDKTRRSGELLLAFLGKPDVQVRSVERRQVFDWLRNLEKSVSGSTAFAHLSNLRNVFKWLIARGDLLGDNPFVGQSVKAAAQHEQYQLFETAELRQIHDLMKEQPAELGLLYQMGLHTGARLAELAELKVEQVILEADIPYLLIKTGKQKTGAPSKFRMVPIADAVLPMVRTQYETAKATGSEYLFCDLTRGNRADGRVSSAISQRFSRVKQKVTMDRSKAFHSLRVHAATWCQAQHIPEHITSTLLGHTNGQTMSYAYYAKQNPDLLPYKEAIELLAEKVKEALG